MILRLCLLSILKKILEDPVGTNKYIRKCTMNCIHRHFFVTVTGEANFSMGATSLTVGGFNQPAVARALIELPGNAEKELSQRFLWLFPKPTYADFDSLEPADKTFADKIGK